jgi:hypothetical protein
MPPQKGFRAGEVRIAVPVDMEELQRTVDEVETDGPLPSPVKMYEAVAKRYLERNPNFPQPDRLTPVVVRLRFDKSRTPTTTLTSKTMQAVKDKKQAKIDAQKEKDADRAAAKLSKKKKG